MYSKNTIASVSLQYWVSGLRNRSITICSKNTIASVALQYWVSGLRNRSITIY
ncbi:hypothetical protein BgiBS90_011796, partial [Biomphalaria glabrata]